MSKKIIKRKENKIPYTADIFDFKSSGTFPNRGKIVFVKNKKRDRKQQMLSEIILPILVRSKSERNHNPTIDKINSAIPAII